jgi:hypothetical protein
LSGDEVGKAAQLLLPDALAKHWQYLVEPVYEEGPHAGQPRGVRLVQNIIADDYVKRAGWQYYEPTAVRRIARINTVACNLDLSTGGTCGYKAPTKEAISMHQRAKHKGELAARAEQIAAERWQLEQREREQSLELQRQALELQREQIELERQRLAQGQAQALKAS